MRAIVCFVACATMLSATVGDAAAQRRGMGGGGGRMHACRQTVSEAHPLGSPGCQKLMARLERCRTYVRGNVRSPKREAGMAQIRSCMHGRPDPYLTHFGAAGGNMYPGARPHRRSQ
jgi:hypothetical protein